MSLNRTGILLRLMGVWFAVTAAGAAEKSPSVIALKQVAPPTAARRGRPNLELGLQIASSFDAGDAYSTPNGPRKLRRLAGAIALPAGENIGRQFTASGQALANYTADAPPTHGIAIFNAPPSEKRAQLADPAKLSSTLRKLRSTAAGKLANPVFIDPDTGLRLLATTNLIVQLRAGVNAKNYFGAAWEHVRPLGGSTNQFILSLPKTTAEKLFAEVTRRAGHPQVEWAEPDFLQQIVKAFTPDDPRFPDQWHLNNTGQFGAKPGADVKLPGAWDITLGNSNVVIAIIDDGVQIDHPDLAANVFHNPGEIPDNGIDDDHNGLVDDVNGWDFFGHDNDPRPDDPDDNHGTSLAGVVAGVGDNALGVSGAAPRCQILPLKIIHGADSVPVSSVSAVVRYAAGLSGGSTKPWRGADLINISLVFPRSFVVDSALTDAATKGRNGRGCPIFCAAGNGAEAWRPIEVDIPFDGTYTLRWQFTKDESDLYPIGADTVWLDNVIFPDGTTYTFEDSDLPSGWTTGGSAAWTRVTDGVNGNRAMTGWGGPNSHALRAGRITHNQTSWLEVTTSLTAGTLTFWTWTESEAAERSGELVGFDAFQFFLNGVEMANDFGVPLLAHGLSYPAKHAGTIAVGASTDFDFRADYSQFGTGLDFVASSDGGFASITTTDRTGANGYNLDPGEEGDYTARFGGTSSATPLAAGIAALVLSVNPYLSAAEVRALMRGTCDQIGDEAYDSSDRNLRYGSGRLNAARAVSRAMPNLKVILTDTPRPVVIGDITTYTLTVRNIGSSRSGPLTVTQQLPGGVAFGSAKPLPAGRSGNALTFTNGGLASGASLTFTIVVTNMLLGTSVSTASVTNDVKESSFADNSATAMTLVLPVPAISISDAVVAEGDSRSTNALFTVSLSNPSSRPVAVRFATAGQTAASGRDFAFLSGRLAFAPGETNKSISVRVVGDLLNEDDETFVVNLSAPVNATLADAQGLGTIVDNDPLPALSITNVTVAEGNSGVANALFRVRLTPVSGRIVTVHYATAPGTATEGSDFIGTNGTLTFLPGQIAQRITVKIIGDLSQETNETFFVNLDSPINATLASSQGIGTIPGNDGRPKLYISDATVTEGDEGTTNAIFKVRLSPASGLPVAVWWFTTNGTATGGDDFDSIGATLLEFAPGQTNQEIVVPVLGDRLSESNETFFVRLVNPTNATLADAVGIGTILDDDRVAAPFIGRELSVTLVKLTPAGLLLRFGSVPDRRYCVECCTDIKSTALWHPVPDADNIAGTGSAVEVLVPASATTPQCFYRVRVLR